MKGITKDNKIIEIPYIVDRKDNYISVTISKSMDFNNIEYIELDYFAFIASNDEDGYMLLPRGKTGNKDYTILYFNKHNDDFDNIITQSNIPVFGVKTKEKTFLAHISGMPYDYDLKVELKNGKYRAYPIFNLFGETPYEDIKIEFYMLHNDDADYSGMARKYRQIIIDNGDIIPLKDRLEGNETLKYTAESVMVRVRCGWKPAPPKILHQTYENEPEMFVACDFDRVSDILDELKLQGVEKCEICLVGWNVKGHDGRWPETFPVCEELGGEEKLRILIKKAQSMGYQITCHTNSTDQYEIANVFDIENTRQDRFNNPVINPCPWSGGQMFDLCPQISYEQAKDMLPKVASLGFKGTHYIDVISTVFPRKCYHKDHFVNSGKAVEYARKIGELSKELFGGFSSEGGYDYTCPFLDYGLYISFYDGKEELMDKTVPFWQLVYHGMVLSNPYCYTVNPNFKDKNTQLKLIEYGGRPSYYFYSAFRDNGSNWMGDIDARCRNNEELKDSVSKIKDSYDEYKNLLEFTTAFMEKHEEVEDNVYEITYSNGKTIRVDYNKEEYSVI